MNYVKSFVITVIALSLIGCWSSEEKKTDSNTERTDVDKTAKSKGTDDKNESGNDSGLENDSNESEDGKKSSNGVLTPVETLKAYDEASNAKKPAEVKNLISKSSVALMEKRAKEEGITFDKLIRDGNGIPAIEAEETRNEKVSGDTATIEIRYADIENFESVPFVKEDGVWKIDFVKFLDEMKKKLNN